MKNFKRHLFVGSIVVLILALVGCKAVGEQNTLGDAFLDKAYANVKSAYGEDYIPSMTIEDPYLQEVYGLDLSKIDKVIAEGPMMSVHVDTFIGIKAAQGQVDALEKSLIDYRDKLISEGMQYPMNLAKVNASKVYKIKDHVFFIMLGASTTVENQSEEEALQFAKAQVQIAIDAIEETQK